MEISPVAQMEINLRYCGPDSEEAHYTTQEVETQYFADCNIYHLLEGHIKSTLFGLGTKLTVTCYSDVDGGKYVRTTEGYYVVKATLLPAPDRSRLEDCGPMGRIVERSLKSRASSGDSASAQLANRDLVNLTAGEEWTHCREQRTNTSAIVASYRTIRLLWLNVPKARRKVTGF
ncbi:hypothetical protein G7Y89_g9708 [Cudoniella acicularis]|uniref:Uncharacterized protein n=1 Tax=Cudoniella acicularis TaxID=354080 RepID=A0A8H4W1M0_9HELO|nr:hypothetical protein G7Y89_g9708 [Cudoniella acicularis]